jgi:hypothetical protein
MEEITRFQQLRQAQKLPAEQKFKVGIPLYPDNSLSDLSHELKKIECDKMLPSSNTLTSRSISFTTHVR